MLAFRLKLFRTNVFFCFLFISDVFYLFENLFRTNVFFCFLFISDVFYLLENYAT